jgi:hypothetical protein
MDRSYFEETWSRRTLRVLADVGVPGKLGGRQWKRKLEKWVKRKTGNQQDQMEEFHRCPMLQKELQELRKWSLLCKRLRHFVENFGFG